MMLLVLPGLVYMNFSRAYLLVENLIDSAVVMEETYKSAKIAGEIYAGLKREGNLINDADILIASIVKDYDAILVTNNEEHFKRAKGLKVENWLKG